MSYSAKILLDSISETGKRLTTFEITFPRIVLAEFNTHRMFSRNSASSRAIPFKKQLERVTEDPFIPARFPINGPGMQPQEYYEPKPGLDIFARGSTWYNPEGYDYDIAKNVWLDARDRAIVEAKRLVGQLPAAFKKRYREWESDEDVFLNVHKQIANRLLEPFQWHTVICTATEFDNFFKLRTHPDAQAEIKTIADLMYDCYYAREQSRYEGNACGLHDFHPTAQELKIGEWHCPLIQEEDRKLIAEKVVGDLIGDQEEYNTDYWIKECTKRVSVARCARISYLTHDGKRDIVKDLELYEKLIKQNHWSPTEHVATPLEDSVQWSGNFQGWKQHRKEFDHENCIYFRKT